MKNLVILSFALLALSNARGQGCLPEGIIFTSQAQINSFQFVYPNCIQIEGDVKIYGSNIYNLNGLSVLSSIGGSLTIGIPDNGTSLTSLTGLEGLTSIGGDLTIAYNSLLANCEIESICSYLASPNGTVAIGYNAPGCNNPPEIAAGCGITLPCLPYGNYYFFTQAEIDNFQSDYPGCTAIEGDVYIRGNDITNLNGLSEVISISGGLNIYSTVLLANLTGLDNLAWIGEDLVIQETLLNDMTGLENLDSIGGSLSISIGNDSLASLSGLDNLSSIGGDLTISSNDSLTSLTGLENLNSIGGDLTISHNDALTSLTGLEGLTFIGGSFYIYKNYSLDNLWGLDELSGIGGSLWIGIIGWFASYGNPSLTSLSGLDSLSSIGGGIIIVLNPILSDLSGLDALANIGGGLSIFNNGLSSLSGLDSLTSIGGGISISGNASLTTLEGLNNIDAGSILNLSITGNPLLATCEIESICTYLASPNGTVDIYNNAPGCNNPPEVASGCGITLPCLPYGNYHFSTQAEIDNFQSDYPGCTSLWGDVVIIGNDIINLDSLNIITSIEGSLTIGDDHYGNPGLTSITGLENLSSIGGDLDIHYNGALTSLTGLDNLNSIGGGLQISDNSTLTSLSGLDNLTSIGGFLGIYNSAFTSLTGLDNLTSIAGDLDIYSNDSLTSLTGLDYIDAGSINDLYIQNNILLSTCDVQSICDYLTSPNGSIDIRDNATGCNSQEVVEAACGVGLDENATPDPHIIIYPNPASTTITISTPTTPEKNTILAVYNLNGQQIILRQITEQQTVVDVSGLPPGIYFYRLAVGGQRSAVNGKMVKY